MRSRGIALGLARQHAAQLDHPIFIVQRRDQRACPAVMFDFAHFELVVGLGGHLRQVSDDEYLGIVTQPS
jgi:hypothetical protein